MYPLRLAIENLIKSDAYHRPSRTHLHRNTDRSVTVTSGQTKTQHRFTNAIALVCFLRARELAQDWETTV